jgi:hypothetical protein
MKQKKKQLDVGKTVRHISREIFFGKIPRPKTKESAKAFKKGSRGKNRRVDSSRDHSPFLLPLCIIKKNVAHETYQNHTNNTFCILL